MNSNAKGGRPRKLTDNQKMEILNLSKDGRRTNADIANIYGVSERTVERVKKEMREREGVEEETRSRLCHNLSDITCRYASMYNYYSEYMKSGENKNDIDIGKLESGLNTVMLEIVKKTMQESGYRLLMDDRYELGRYGKFF